MNPIQDSEKLVGGRKDSNIRRPVPKYQHYIDHFEELYRQSPLAKVMGQNASSSIPSKRNADNSISSNTSGSFKVPLVSPMLKPKPVPALVGAFIMSPVAHLIQQMQSTGGVAQKDGEKEHASTSHVEMMPPESIENEDWHDSERNDVVQREQRLVPGGTLSCFQPEHGQEVESSEVADTAVSSTEAEEEDDASLYTDVPNVKDVTDEMDGEMEPMEKVEDTEIKGSDPDSCDKPILEASPLGSVSKAREKRKSLRRKAVKSTSDLEHSNIDSCDDVAKLAGTVTDLDQWIIKWLGSGLKHIAVEGHRLEDPEGSFWHSTAIIKRNSSCLVETSSGSRYSLHGNINKLLARDQGFSKKFLRRFQKGFPAKWKAYLVEEAMEQSGKKVEVTVPESTDIGTAKASNTPVINGGRLATHKVLSTLKKEKRPAVTKTPSNDSETTPVSRRREAVVVTPSFVSVEEVRTTRSGRKVLPPLEYWRGQRQRTLLYMEGAAELLEGSIDHTPVSATRLGVKGSIDISQRAKRLVTRKKNPRSRKRAEKSKNTTSQRESSFEESESEDDPLDRMQKRVVNARTERNSDTSNTMKAGGEECSLDALPEQGSFRRSPRKSLDTFPKKSLDTSDHQKSRDTPRSLSQTSVCDAVDVSPPVSGVGGDATNKSSQPYDLYSEVMGVVKENRQRRISNQSRRRRSREANRSSSSAPEQGEENFNISDDEDFKNKDSASATEGDNKNSSLSRKPKGSPVPSTSNKSISKHKRKVSSKANERVLLGSNMVACVVLEKNEHSDLNAGVKIKGSSGSGKQDKAEQATKKKTKEAPPKSRISKRIQESNEKWKPDELHRLHRALKIIPPSSRQFWHRVASSVGTRTEWECQQEHQAKLEEATKASNQSKGTTKGTTKDNKESNQGAKEPVALTAAKGTMKRKRQLRELIQQHNQASEEDLFDSTPFKKQRKTTKPLLNLDLAEEEEEEDDDEGMQAKTPGSARLKTPSTRFHNLLAPLSGKRTPHSSAIISPGLLNSVEKKHMDKYIFGMQKKRASRRGKNVPETTHNVSPPLKVRQRQLKTQTMAMTPTISEAFQVDPVQGTDSDEDEGDYYWSDEENNSAPNSKKH
ncbi:uncharacterized protein LOC579784 isoform X2 [Strongylocentrotus purpuratus]|uniref:SANTA domain-containing protein n=1 Tax=Strongylocentrotus purpuratus TaxID=7668 RepID=A0A7M7T582_STRPU|nr:uncharacterized protein LOC579784 isoform X2 [Strongylocentrotus purpuratus]